MPAVNGYLTEVLAYVSCKYEKLLMESKFGYRYLEGMAALTSRPVR
jgi:hypothetical protein